MALRRKGTGSMPPPPARPLLNSSQAIPPSSSIALIVQNLPKTSDGREALPSKETFLQLLQEIVAEAKELPIAPDDVARNHILIPMITGAGLDVLLQDDPFASNEELFDAAAGSLRVLQITIERTPQVLFCAPPPNNSQPDQPFLGIWLLSRFFAILGHPPAHGLTEKLYETVQAIFLTAAKRSEDWVYLRIMADYLQSCLNCVVRSLTNKQMVTAVLSRSYALELPSSSFTIDPSSLEGANSIDCRKIRFKLDDPGKVAYLGTRLFQLFIRLSASSQSSQAMRYITDQIPATIQGISKIWRILKIWDSLPMLFEKTEVVRLHVLEVFDYALETLPFTMINEPRYDGLYHSAARCLVDIFQRSIERNNQLIEQTSAGIILGLLVIVKNSSMAKDMLRDRLVPLLCGIMDEEAQWKLLCHDLQISALRLVLHLVDPGAAKVQDSLNAAGGSWTCKDKCLDKKLKLVCSLTDEGVLSVAIDSRKRRKLETVDEPKAVFPSLTSKIYNLLGKQNATELGGLHQIAQRGFNKLTEDDRQTAISTLGLLACAEAGDLRRERIGTNLQYSCDYCDSALNYHARSRKYAVQHDIELLKTFEALYTLEGFQNSPQIRAHAMGTLKRLLNHTKDLAYLDLEMSPLGQWCVGSLHSSRRELRVAAGRALPSFMTIAHDRDVLDKNQTAIFKELSEIHDPKVEETVILAWGQLGRTLTGQELGVVVIKLVEYLGHPTRVIMGVALSELHELARAHEQTPRKLVSQFWRLISVNVVKQLLSKPQLIQILCEFMEMDKNAFLRATKAYTLPYLVLWRKKDIIQKIAEAEQKSKKVHDILHENIAPILAVLFVQGFQNVEESSHALLQHASHRLGNSTLEELARPDAMGIAGELLKVMGDAAEDDEETRQRIMKALVLVAFLSGRNPKKTKQKNKPGLASFFEGNVLGLCSLFGDRLKDSPAITPTVEKDRCVRAIKEMMVLIGDCITGGLPQICACLQSALDSDPLRTSALKAWAAMLYRLPEPELKTILGQTISIILQFWDRFDNSAQETAFDMIEDLFRRHLTLLKESVAVIPSLSSIPLLSKFEKRLKKEREEIVLEERLKKLVHRCSHENGAVVEQALIELLQFMKEQGHYVHTAATAEDPNPIVAMLIRSLLNAIVAFKESDDATPSRSRIERLCTECLGLIGAVDPAVVESSRMKSDIVVLHNFSKGDESLEFVMFFLEKIVVKAFRSATDSKAQGFLAWASQELLKFCDFTTETIFEQKRGDSHLDPHHRWTLLSETAKETLMPFLTSKYHLAAIQSTAETTYPIFDPRIKYRTWITTFLLDILSKPYGENARNIFSICIRIVKGQDISIPHFLLPYAVMHVVISGSEKDRENIVREFLTVMKHKEEAGMSVSALESLRNCSEAVFSCIDHMSKWLRDKKEWNNENQKKQREQRRYYSDEQEYAFDDQDTRRVEGLLNTLPPDLTAARSLDLKSYPRALYFWEQHIRQTRTHASDEQMEPLYEELQRIYANIDEPDGIEGISTKIPNLDIEQQILEHHKAGRWTAAQSWYEMMLAEKPGNVEYQAKLITCLRDSGQHELLLRQFDGILARQTTGLSQLLPYAVEASWISGNWQALETYLALTNDQTEMQYDVRLGHALSALRKGDLGTFSDQLTTARGEVAAMMTEQATGSIRVCHKLLVKLHAISELQEIVDALRGQDDLPKPEFKDRLDRRLKLMGTYSDDKKYVLAIRRAAYELVGHPATGRLVPPTAHVFGRKNHAVIDDLMMSAWLSTANLARKDNQAQAAFNAIHHAARISKPQSVVEHAKLLWHTGQDRNAIRNISGAIKKGVLDLVSENDSMATISTTTTESRSGIPTQNKKVAKAKLLLAKWIEKSRRENSSEIGERYRDASSTYQRWEQGFYYVGRYYNKLYEAEKQNEPEKVSQPFLNGEITKLVVHNYFRALAFGVKYVFQTLPRLLRLWMDLGDEISSTEKPKNYGNETFLEHMKKHQIRNMTVILATCEKYFQKFPAWVFYTAFPQILSRIVHKHDKVSYHITCIIVRVCKEYPRQALWSLMAVSKSMDPERRQRGTACLLRLKVETGPRSRTPKPVPRIPEMIDSANSLTASLLSICNIDIPGRTLRVSITKDLLFKNASVPVPLVIPSQAFLSITLPSQPDAYRLHNPFSSNQPTIESFADDVDVMTSLQKPRKVIVRGSDGKEYAFLCKPKDDLRKDMRLMEFNTMINRFLKRDAESSRRSLYIRTYAVTPLNEECGLIEWVNNVRPLRDIIVRGLKIRGINLSYQQCRIRLDEACKDSKSLHIFTDEILTTYPPVFHEWFREVFSEPADWFAARLRYTRTSAVMSMVGYILGLGDRHGENILFSTKNGDTLHVDFNCLFDKGLSFDKPERVPFRLTHNMVDAFGPAGYEGVFRKACESAMRLLRHNDESMLSVLEAFIHDPAVDMVPKKMKNKLAKRNAESPKEILENIQKRLKGMWEGENLPLSVQGQVENLIKAATDPSNLCAMYIGWCPMF